MQLFLRCSINTLSGVILDLLFKMDGSVQLPQLVLTGDQHCLTGWKTFLQKEKCILWQKKTHTQFQLLHVTQRSPHSPVPSSPANQNKLLQNSWILLPCRQKWKLNKKMPRSRFLKVIKSDLKVGKLLLPI